MDISKATDLELVRELAKRIENNPNPEVYNNQGCENHYKGTEIEFYIDDGEDSFCLPTFSFDKDGKLKEIRNNLNCSFEEKLDEYLDNNRGEDSLLQLAKQALEYYGVY